MPHYPQQSLAPIAPSHGPNGGMATQHARGNSRHPPQGDVLALLGEGYLARRYTESFLPPRRGLGSMSFNSSPERLTVIFASVPSMFGNRAPSTCRVTVLSASLTDQVPKLAASPIAA